MQQKLCELYKKLIKLVGHDNSGVSRRGPQHMQSHAVLSILDLTHVNVKPETSSGESSAQWLHQVMQQISHTSFTTRVQFFIMLSCSYLFLTKLLSSAIVFILVLSEPAL